MASTNICKFNKFSHCKYSRFCNFYHENKKCEIKNCDAKKCNLRHPAPCRNILQGKVCPFGNFCSFEHSLENAPSKPLETDLKTKVEVLEKLLLAKNEEIRKLEEKTAAKAMESSVAIKIDALEKVLLAKDEKICNPEETLANNNNTYSSDEDTKTTSPEIGPGGLSAPCVLACAMRSLAIVITIVQSFSLSFYPFFAFDPLRGNSHVRNNFSPNILA